MPLERRARAARARRLLELLVPRHAGLEVVAALRGDHVLHAHVEVLVDDAAVDLLGHADADRALGDVVDLARAAVVVLEGHALDLGRVALDVDVVAQLVLGHVRRHLDHAPLAEGPREHVARARAAAERVRHGVLSPLRVALRWLRTCAPAAGRDLRTLGATAASSLPLVADLHASDAARSAFARRGVTAWPRVRLSVHGRVSQQSVCVLACRRPAGATRSLRAGPWRPARRQSESCKRGRLVLAVHGRRAPLFCILRQPHLQLSTRHSLSIPDTAKDLCTLYARCTSDGPLGRASGFSLPEEIARRVE